MIGKKLAMPSGNLLHSYWKIHNFEWEDSRHFDWAIFHSYVKLPEGLFGECFQGWWCFPLEKKIVGQPAGREIVSIHFGVEPVELFGGLKMFQKLIKLKPYSLMLNSPFLRTLSLCGQEGVLCLYAPWFCANYDTSQGWDLLRFPP